MSLYDLAKKTGFGVESDRSRRSSVALAFALNVDYLEPFKVFLTSLIIKKTMLDAPIIVYSDDARVLKDPVVKLVSDQCRMIDGKLRDRLYRLAKENVRRPERGGWNRGTFLKWSIFESHGVDKILFLDADMICLQKLEGFIQEDHVEEFVCCPQFQPSIKKSGDEELLSEEIHGNLIKLLDGEFFDRHSWRVNSGMMLVKGSLLSEAFRDELLEFAGSRIAIHEQGHLSDYFRNSDNRKMVSVANNFQEIFLNRLLLDQAREVAGRIRILHFAGRTKPWGRDPRIDDRSSFLIWHAFRTAGAKILAL